MHWLRRIAAQSSPRRSLSAADRSRHLPLGPQLRLAGHRPAPPAPHPQPLRQRAAAEQTADSLASARTRTLEHEPEELPATADDAAAQAATLTTSSSEPTSLPATARPQDEALEAASSSPPSLAALLMDRIRSRYDRPLTLSRGPHQELELPTFRDGHKAITLYELKRDFKVWGPALALSCTLAVGSWVAFYVYCEEVGLAAPASLWEGAAAGSDDDDPWGWAHENDDWTGDRAGGTSASLPLEVRRLLHFGWFALFWPLGPSEQEVRDEMAQQAQAGDEGKESPSLLARLRDWDGSVHGSGLFSDAQRSLAQLPSAAMAEVLVRSAIETMLADPKINIWLPPPLKDGDLPLPPAALHRPRIPRPDDPTGVALLVLHGTLLEKVGSPETLERAQALFERVLWAVNGCEGAETLEAQLARRIGDLGRLNGDPRAEQWLRWGIERVTGYRPTDGGNLSAPLDASSTSSTWKSLKSLWSSPAVVPVDAEIPATHAQPTIASLLALKPPADLPPARLRALLSLIASLSAVESQTDSLAAARETQAAALNYIARALSPSPGAASSAASAARRLHELALERYRALFSIHLAEVLYASDGEDARGRTPASLLDEAYRGAMAVSTGLTSPSSARPTPPEHDSIPFPQTSIDGAKRHPLPPAPTAPYTSPLRPGVLQQPAADLLSSGRRTAASAANLLGLLALQSSAAEPDRAALVLAAKYYAAAMTLIGPAPPAPGAPADGGIGGTVVVVSSEGKEELADHQSDEWRRYFANLRGVQDRLASMGV